MKTGPCHGEASILRVTRCQKVTDGADWLVPRTGAKLWLSNQLWRILPCTECKNMTIEVPLKAANSAILKDYCS